jgi:hypothetical protein
MMVTTTSTHELDREQRSEMGWLQLVNRAVFLRSAIIAAIIGSVLTLINQPGWVLGFDPLQLMPLILVFATPFVVVAISQVVAARQAFIDAVRHETRSSRPIHRRRAERNRFRLEDGKVDSSRWAI